jgi:hypothetical protein
MIRLTSQMESMQDSFHSVQEKLQAYGFTLGGNWDYDHGYFDRSLDERNTVWLRIPFQVTRGNLEGDTGTPEDTMIELGSPFVLKHLYEDNIDQEGQSGVMRGLIDQFQDPAQPDAELEEKWIRIAEQELSKAEAAILS